MEVICGISLLWILIFLLTPKKQKECIVTQSSNIYRITPVKHTERSSISTQEKRNSTSPVIDRKGRRMSFVSPSDDNLLTLSIATETVLHLTPPDNISCRSPQGKKEMQRHHQRVYWSVTLLWTDTFVPTLKFTLLMNRKLMRLDDTVIAQFLRQVFEFQQLYRKHSETCRRNNCFQSLDIDIDESLKSWSTLQSLIVKNKNESRLFQ